MAFNDHHDSADFEVGERVTYRPATGIFPARGAGGGGGFIRDGLRWQRSTIECGRPAVVSAVRGGQHMTVQLEPAGCHYGCHPEELRKVPQPRESFDGFVEEELREAMADATTPERRATLHAIRRGEHAGLRELG